jgi:hypothetical protein
VGAWTLPVGVGGELLELAGTAILWFRPTPGALPHLHWIRARGEVTGICSGALSSDGCERHDVVSVILPTLFRQAPGGRHCSVGSMDKSADGNASPVRLMGNSSAFDDRVLEV